MKVKKNGETIGTVNTTEELIELLDDAISSALYSIPEEEMPIEVVMNEIQRWYEEKMYVDIDTFKSYNIDCYDPEGLGEVEGTLFSFTLEK